MPQPEGAAGGVVSEHEGSPAAWCRMLCENELP